MRTTIRLDDRLLAEAKQWAAESGWTLTAVFEDALRAALARRKAATKCERVRLITGGEGGLRPGVDLDNTAELLEIMERSDAAG
jgi:hypothetical protein